MNISVANYETFKRTGDSHANTPTKTHTSAHEHAYKYI